MDFDSSPFLFEVYQNGLRLGVYANNGAPHNGVKNEFVSTITELIIPSYVNGLPVVALGYRCLREVSNAKTAFIPKTVVEFQGDVFTLCEALEIVTFEEGIRLKTIAHYGFFQTNISQLIFPKYTTGIDGHSFFQAVNLKYLFVHNFMHPSSSATSIFTGVPLSLTIYVPSNYPFDEFANRNVTKILPPFFGFPIFCRSFNRNQRFGTINSLLVFCSIFLQVAFKS